MSSLFLKELGAVLTSPTVFLIYLLLAAPVQAQTLRYLGQQVLPHNFEYGGTTVGGLSGLDYDPVSNRFVAISDDRSERQPARFYTLRLDLAEFNMRSEPGHTGIQILGVTTLRDHEGKAHAEGTVDPEAIRHAGDGGYWWASEGSVKRGIPPAIVKVGADGTALRQLDLPPHVKPGNGAGVRDNLAFESLALMNGLLITGTENALEQDGPVADLDQPSAARLLVFDAASGRQVAEHVYLVDAVPLAPPLPGLYRSNGLVELLGGDGMLLSLERSYTVGAGNSVRVYRLDLAGATDVSTLSVLAGTVFAPIVKTLVLDLRTRGIALDNLEGMSWGPRSPDGRRTLLLVSDNNFSGRQKTQFLAFELME